MLWIASFALCVLLVEALRRLPLMSVATEILQSTTRAVRVIGSSKISDHWKEKAIGAYAVITLRGTLKLAVMMVGVLGGAALLVYTAERLGVKGFSSFFLSWEGLAYTAIGASLYAWARSKATRGQSDVRVEATTPYSAVDKLLYELALGNQAVTRFSYRLDQRLTKPNRAQTAAGQHVFIAGLARAGTTVLMRRFHASGKFRSLTYRDMPFVLAPNLWRMVGGSSGGAAQAAERAHGDNILVNIDSPESLDEVFWRAFSADDYITNDSLRPHFPSHELCQEYVSYIGAILSRSGTDRYLSKNNNNVLRIKAIRETFPAALILIPFRDPLAHAGSLLKQHLRFMNVQQQDRFVLSYMNWLGHHEFGRGHRPFCFDDGRPTGDPSSIDYWIGVWISTYAWLLANAPADTIFLGYERLCTDPSTWPELAQIACIDPGIVSDGGFRLAQTEDLVPKHRDQLLLARDVYHQLVERGNTTLGKK